jgi:phospholipid/cholesterol/gamma-HCH transport system substrate-binding protein
MSETFVPPVRFSRLVLKVNAFLLVALLMVAAFMGLVAYKQGWFVHQTVIHFVTPNALGINNGMPVKLYGFTVGSVSTMELSQEGVDVRLSIISEHMPRIPKGSQAKFAREAGLVGASVIEILPGPAGPAIAEGERIDFQPSRGISEIIDDFRRQAVPAFNEVKQLMSQLKGPGEDVAVSLAGLRKEVQLLPETHRAVRKLLENADREASTTLQAAQRATETVERAVPMLAGKLATAIDSLDAAATQLRRTGEEAQGTLQRARPLLDRGESAAREAGDVFSAAKRVWPLSDSFKEVTDGELPIDSFDARGKAPRL